MSSGGASNEPGLDTGALRISFAMATTVGGIGRHVHSLVERLVARGHQIRVIGPRSVEEEFRFAGTGAAFTPWEVADRPRPLQDLRATLAARRLLRDVDIAHAHGVRAGALIALALIGRRQPQLVVTLHNAPVRGGWIGATYDFLEYMVARRAGLVSTVSPDLSGRASKRGARVVERAVIAAPHTLPQRGRAAVRAELAAGQRPIVLAVGRLTQQKGFSTLLEASRRWTDWEPPPLVVVAGEGPLRRELTLQINAHELPVRLLGRRSDIADLLTAADVFVLPSLWEGQSLVLQEALRSGCSIVATAVGGTPDVVGDAALLVPSRDANAIDAAVTSILNNSELAARLSRAATTRAASLPSDEEAVDALLRSYQELPGRGRRGVGRRQ